MIPFECIVVLPAPAGSPSRQARECLLGLESRLDASGRTKSHTLALTFFSDATDPAEHAARRRDLLTLVRDHFDGDPPPVSVVAQAPDGRGHLALEAAVLADPDAGVSVSRPTCEGLAYTVVTGPGGIRQIYGGGIASDEGLGDTVAQARDAFSKMEAILSREGVTYDRLVRQWGYIEGVLDVRADGHRKSHQGYQAFNDVRTLAYGRSEFPAGYPAATGIGQAAGGVLLEFLAIDAPPHQVRVVPLSNPRQTDAHDYSTGQLVGESLDELPAKSTPKFERAKLVALEEQEVLFVSGTAAIRGERSVAPGDVAAQTRTTIDNIAALIGDRGLSRLRAYVKRTGDIPVVRSICEAAYGPIPALYVRADICRDELLVELEGATLSQSADA